MSLAIGNTIDPHTRESRPIPFEYVEYFMCRYVYHCDPITLSSVPYTRVMEDFSYARIEAEAEAFRRK